MGIYCDYELEEFSQANGEIVSCFRSLTNDNALQLYFTRKVFTTSNIYPQHSTPAYNFYVFDIRYDQYFALTQPIKVKSEISSPLDAAVGLSR